jgi:hypothetical protein
VASHHECIAISRAARHFLPSIIPGQFVVTMREDIPNLNDILERYAAGALDEPRADVQEQQ